MEVKRRKRREHLSEQQKKHNKNEKINAKRLIWQGIKSNLATARDSDDSDESEVMFFSLTNESVRFLL